MEKSMRSDWQVLLVLLVALGISVATIGLGEVAASATRERVREAQLSAQTEATKRAAARATGILASYARKLVEAVAPRRDGAVAPIVVAARSGDLGGINAALADAGMQMPFSGEIYLVNVEGIIVAGYSLGANLAIEIAQGIRARPYPLPWADAPESRLGAVFMRPDEFGRTFAGPAIYLSDLYEPLDRAGTRMSAASTAAKVRPGTLRRARISIGVRILGSDGRVAGALVADTYSLQLSDATEEVGEMAAEAYILDQRGRLIHRRSVIWYDAETHRDLSTAPVIRTLIDGGVVRGEGDDPLGAGLRLMTSARTPDVPGDLRQDLLTGWHVISAQPLDRVFADLDRELGELRAIRLSLVLGILVFALLLTAAMRRGTAQRRALAGANASLSHANAKLADVSRELEAASRHKSEFLANMSHEIRTPLNAVIGFADVLGEKLAGELNDRQAEYVRDIASSGKHLLDLVNEILDLSKVEAGRMELDPTEFDLGDTVRSALLFIRERAARHAIELAADVPAGLGLVTADERKIRQVILNLLSNAVKFTPRGGWIGVAARRKDGELEVSVRDSGIGISDEDRAAVFEEFRQVGSAVERPQEGTGLGLTLAKRFVELHGGRIWVESQVGKGSTFTFAIPVRQTALVDAKG